MPDESGLDLEACLPPALRGPDTTISVIAAGLSGAGVYRVDAGGRSYVLKRSADGVAFDAWRGHLTTLRAAAAAGLAPRIVHVDETHRAVVSEFVVDQSFVRRYRDPATGDAALAQLGRTLRRVHDLPLPHDVASTDARTQLERIWASLGNDVAMPAFVGDTVRGLLAEEMPESGRPLVLSHNDVNPSNLVHDGERLLLLDWDAAGANDPYYDLAVVAMFLRMDVASCLTMLGAYDNAPVSELPARFAYDRRLAAVLAGTTFFSLHPGHRGGATPDAQLTLGECYERMRSGAMSLASPEGQRAFALALIREGAA